jgi:molybdenum cofactor cytidylyltransferase
LLKTALILLSAGSSSRMKRNKALLDWNSDYLINHQLKQLELLGHDVFLVLGKDSELIKSKLTPGEYNVIENFEWEQGMSSSIKCSLNYIKEKSSQYDSFMFIAVDQPLLDFEYYSQMIDEFYNGSHSIVVSQTIDEKLSIPAMFSIDYLGEFDKLIGDKGAKKIILDNLDNTFKMPSTYKVSDMDVKSDVVKLQKIFFSNKS